MMSMSLLSLERGCVGFLLPKRTAETVHSVDYIAGRTDIFKAL